MLRLFKIKQEERWLAVVALVLVGAWNALMVIRYFPPMSHFSANHLSLACRTMQISGFDPFSWSVISDWNCTDFSIFRHPLLAIFCLPLCLLNRLLILITGANCAVPIVAVVETFFGVYSAVFLYRVLHEVVGARRSDATLLTLMFFTFAFITLTVMVPDHFNVSMCLLFMFLYVCGIKMKGKRLLGTMETAVMMLVSAGVSLTNGVKIGLGALFTNGRKLFRPRYLLLAIIVPAAVVWGTANIEYQVWQRPVDVARAEKAKAVDKAFRDSIWQAVRLRHPNADSAGVAELAEKEHKRLMYIQYLDNHRNMKKGKPLSNKGFLAWTDVETSRWKTVKENLFGESIQLHKANLLENLYSSKRPIIVPYETDYHYWVECLIALLLLGGIAFACRSRFFWLVFSWVLFDMALFLGLGFGINEIYLMTAQWAFIIPIAMAYLMRDTRSWLHRGLQVVVGALSIYLALYNWPLIFKHIMQGFAA